VSVRGEWVSVKRYGRLSEEKKNGSSRQELRSRGKWVGSCGFWRGTSKIPPLCSLALLFAFATQASGAFCVCSTFLCIGGLVRASSLSAYTAPAVAQSMAAAAPNSYVLQLAGLSSSTFAEMHSPQDWPASVSEKEELMKKCEEWVKDEIATCDASHDWCHGVSVF
jgi:hypothetical protein